jgi:hypothetical protein
MVPLRANCVLQVCEVRHVNSYVYKVRQVSSKRITSDESVRSRDCTGGFSNRGTSQAVGSPMLSYAWKKCREADMYVLMRCS